MEQLQRDRNYSNYLVRLVAKEASNCGSKDELIDFINKLRKDINNSKVLDYINENNLSFDYRDFEAGIKNVLVEYDRTHEAQINSRDYKQMQAGEKNYIVSKKDGTVLEQDGKSNMGDLSQEFKNRQNEMIGAKSDDSILNANEVFDNMKSEMGQSEFVPLNKIDVNKVSQELISKINFLIRNSKGNGYRVDISRGIFMDDQNNICEVKRNPQTGNYELFVGKQASYVEKNNDKYDEILSDNTNGVTVNDNSSNLTTNDLAMFTDSELKNMENVGISVEKRQAIINELNRRKKETLEQGKDLNKKNTNVKKKTLSKDKVMPNLNGYISTILVTAVSAMSGILIAAFILVNK